MFHGITFTIWRVFELITLIPIVGMLSWFVDVATKRGLLTPTMILVLFIVSVLAAVWALATLVAYHSARYSAMFVAIVDLLFVGALIAGVYYLRAVTHWDCAQWGRGDTHTGGVDVGFFTASGSFTNPLSLHLDKTCAMLKASFALGIMNIIFFFVTFLILLGVHNKYGSGTYTSRRTVTRHRSRSPRHYSRSPRHSHHSSRSYTRRTYV